MIICCWSTDFYHSGSCCADKDRAICLYVLLVYFLRLTSSIHNLKIIGTAPDYTALTEITQYVWHQRLQLMGMTPAEVQVVIHHSSHLVGFFQQLGNHRPCPFAYGIVGTEQQYIVGLKAWRFPAFWRKRRLFVENVIGIALVVQES